MTFLERKLLLRVLYDSYPEKSKIHVNSNVVHVDHLGNDGVVVYTQSGHSYKGDLLVGADGVHSQVRTQMWAISDRMQPGWITRNEKTGMTIGYACIFGISSDIPELNTGQLHLSVCNGISLIVAPGTRGRISWFLVYKLDRTFQYGSAPRFTPADGASQCEKLADMYVWNDVRFSQLWKSRETFSMTALEENTFQTWHYGRIVCIGDSMHKMTPNLAQGANCSIEDAASLANALSELLSAGQPKNRPSDRQVDDLLCHFNEMQIARTSKIYKASQTVVKLQTRENMFWKLLLRYYVPYAGSYPTERALRILENAVVLRFIPIPQRSGPRRILSAKKQRNVFLWIVVTAFPLLISTLFFWYVFATSSFKPL